MYRLSPTRNRFLLQTKRCLHTWRSRVHGRGESFSFVHKQEALKIEDTNTRMVGGVGRVTEWWFSWLGLKFCTKDWWKLALSNMNAMELNATRLYSPMGDRLVLGWLRRLINVINPWIDVCILYVGNIGHNAGCGLSWSGHDFWKEMDIWTIFCCLAPALCVHL